MENYIICGSTYFFKSFEDFKSKDIDKILIVEKGNGYKYMMQVSTNNQCIFKIVYKPKEELIQYALEKSPAMAVGKFLIPEFNSKFNITVNDLKLLQPLIDKLDSKHKYEKIIFESYLENNNFTLTEEQLQKAYNCYKEERNDTVSISQNTRKIKRV